MIDFRQHLLAKSKEELVEMIGEYENALTWDTTCIRCSTLLDNNYEQYVKLQLVQELIDSVKREGGDTAPLWKIERALKGEHAHEPSRRL